MLLGASYAVLFALLFSTSCVYSQSINKLPLKLTVGTYNVGHFNQGRLGGFQGTGKMAKAELNNWKRWIGQQGLDILGLNEWNIFFDKDSTYNATNQLLTPYYSHIYFGKKTRWIYNGIATNLKLQNIKQENFGGDYYAIIGEWKINDEIIHIISVHLPWQKQWHSESLKSLIELLKKYDYFICMGDMNAFDDDQLLFVKNGFNMANGGNMGWFSTAGIGLSGETKC